MVADNVSGTKQQHQANSALEKQVSDLMSTVSQLQGDNKVLMTNQEEMASIYNGREEQSMVPNEIATSGGSSTSPGPDMMSYIGQLIKDGIASATDEKTPNGTKTTTPKKKAPYEEPTWWRQFNKYCATCGVNLQHISKDCKRQRHKDHDETATWADKKGGQTKRDHLWMQWCEPITHKVFKERGAGEYRT